VLPAGGVSLGQFERDLLTQALAQTSWNITRAAKLLGITRDTLRYRMEKFSLRPPGGELS
jgi:two-component system, NtrC family, response regulator AtoC